MSYVHKLTLIVRYIFRHAYV